VGLPFCAFKILTGLTLGRAGWALIALGVLDLVINVVNLVALLFNRPRVLGVCLIAILLGRPREDLGTSIDMLLSFALVALMIGFGWLAVLDPTELAVWNISVILNVLGAGFGRLFLSLRAENA